VHNDNVHNDNVHNVGDVAIAKSGDVARRVHLCKEFKLPLTDWESIFREANGKANLILDPKALKKLEGMGKNVPGKTAFEILKMPGTTLEDVENAMARTFEERGEKNEFLRSTEFNYVAIESEIKYSSYMEKQIREARRMEMGGEVFAVGSIPIPESVRWDRETFNGFSGEELEKFEKVRPRTMGEARRIEGVTAASMERLLSVVRARTDTENKERRRRWKEEEKEKERRARGIAI